MSTIVITGAAGFIGSHISETLLHAGHKIVCLDNLNDYYPPELKKHNLSLLQKFESFEFVKLDIEDQEGVNKIIQTYKPEFLIHCAARAGVRASVQAPFQYTKTNIVGTQVILEALRLYSPQTKSIILSSSSVYGIQATTPFVETMHPNPQSPYGATKYAMELITKQYHDFYNLPIAIVRPFSIYGPRGRIDMAPLLITKAAETGEVFKKFGTNTDNKRDWTYINDFVSGITGLIDHFSFSTFEVFNLGNSTPMGIDDFMSIMQKNIKQYLGKDITIEEHPRGKEDVPITFADVTKAQQYLQYNPQTSLEEGIQKMFAFYNENRELYLSVFKIK